MHELLGWPGPITNRQYQTWLAWRDIKLYGLNPPPPKAKPSPLAMTKQDMIEFSKAAWGVALGAPPPEVKK